MCVNAISVAQEVATEKKPKMKSIVFFALVLVAAVAAAPVDESPQIISAEFNQSPDGSFVSTFQTENGITSEQRGELKQTVDEDNKPVAVIVLRGTYTYINQEGLPETISYVADEEGYRAEGDSIPKTPEARR